MDRPAVDDGPVQEVLQPFNDRKNLSSSNTTVKSDRAWQSRLSWQQINFAVRYLHNLALSCLLLMDQNL